MILFSQGDYVYFCDLPFHGALLGKGGQGILNDFAQARFGSGTFLDLVDQDQMV